MGKIISGLWRNARNKHRNYEMVSGMTFEKLTLSIRGITLLRVRPGMLERVGSSSNNFALGKSHENWDCYDRDI